VETKAPDILIVVRRGDAELFEHLRREFQGPELAVIVDRRMAERRTRRATTDVERRRRERRNLSATWNALGFLVRRRGA
jgi:hypothetical protein